MKSRRKFITGVVTSGLALAGTSAKAADQQERPAAIQADLVRDFVIAGHGNLVKVKEMLDATPGLLNATWDWGGGDFETAIGGAGHMGNREIAEYLLSKGARLDLFQAAMLGKLDIVKSILTAWPELKTSKGPHGIMLIHHATKGGEQAKEVLDYLKSIGAS